MKTSKLLIRDLLLVVLLLHLTGCGLGMLQTAKTLPKGILEFGAGTGGVANDAIEERFDHKATWSFVELYSRMGITDHLEFEGKLQFFPGAQIALKYNFLKQTSPLALSLQAGVGGSFSQMGPAVHVPVAASISYDFPVVTPYAHAGWMLLWNFGLQKNLDVDYVAPTGNGDGILRATGGLCFKVHKWVRLYAEYNYWRTMVNDLGNQFRLPDTHVGLIGASFVTPSPIF
jgi:hypothetical protein